MQPASLKSVLKNALKELDLYNTYKRQKALVLWERVSGKEVAQVSMPVKLKGSVLFVAARDHIWAAEISHFKQLYLEKYAKILGPGVIRDIHFAAKAQAFKTKSQKKVADFEPESVELTRRELKKIDETVSEINDEEAREKFEALMVQKTKYDRWLKKRGGQECFGCGVMIEKGSNFCPHCLRELERKNSDRIRDAIMKTPWLSFSEAVKEINPISVDLFSEIKDNMAESLYKEIVEDMETISCITKSERPQEAARVKISIITLAFMRTGKPPAKLTDDVLRSAVSESMYKFFKTNY